ncbi:hypothetical protein OIU78_030165 [Salix suchowensis]|nr:hypothetical protein OIU78_030165 [Salix suchowensis]
MGNCCSEVAGGREAGGGRAAAAGNDAVNHFLKSRGMYGSQMELSFSATNLRDRDVLSKSDPMLIGYTKGKDGTLAEAFRTEVVFNSLNPTWITKHTITFEFEAVQTLVFCAYDIDTQFHNIDVKVSFYSLIAVSFVAALY